MLTLQQIVKNTEIGVLNRSKFINIKVMVSSMEENKDGKHYLYAGIATDPHSDSRKPHRWFIRRFDDPKLKKFSPQSKIKVACDCENFTYTWEVALLKKGSSVKFNSNGAMPHLTNPKMLGGACKHIIAAMKATMKLVPTKPVKTMPSILRLPKNF